MRHKRSMLLPILLVATQACFAQGIVPARTNWAGNSFPGSGDIVVPSEGARITVAPTGEVLTNCYWDETHNNASVWRDGKFLARAPFMVDSGYQGGDGVTSSQFLVLISQNFRGGEGSNKPPIGMGISFRTMDLKPVQIPGGKGGGRASSSESKLSPRCAEGTWHQGRGNSAHRIQSCW